MKNILIVSLNSGGTMGHGKIITSLASILTKSKKKVTLVSEIDYAQFFDINRQVDKIILPKKEHVNYTIGGMYDYKQKDKIIEICEYKKINCVIFSTFFDLKLVTEIKKRGIKVILLSYPIRDTFRKALIFNKVYSIFDKIISLYDPSVHEERLKNEIITNPLKTVRTIPQRKQTIDILLTCGGGGRPSSKKFINQSISALNSVIKENRSLKVVLIKGNSKSKERPKGVKSIHWSKKFEEIISSSRVIISEAGYFTMLDLINYNRCAILIPGERIIDNQELRALKIESLGLGKVFFPFEKKQKLTRLIKEALNKPDINNSKQFAEIEKKFNKHKELRSIVLKELK